MDKRWLCGWAAIAMVCVAGCGGGEPADRPARVPAGGVVTQNGQPVSGATVVFVPVSHKYGATAITDDAGRFQLRTFAPDDGAVPGSFQVTIRKVEMIDGGAAPASSEGGSGEGGDEEAVTQSVERFLTPEKYARVATSGLTAEVTEGGPNEYSFDMQ